MPNRRFFTANQLKAIALFCMLLDHMWATIVPGREWMTCVGRIAFPIFAFELAQGYTHTHDLRAYAKRLLLLAVVSEVPFDMVVGGTYFYPWHQNVAWTLLAGLWACHCADRCRTAPTLPEKLPPLLGLLAALLLPGLLLTDYGTAGVVIILLFRLTRGGGWRSCLAQAVGLFVVSQYMLIGQVYLVGPFEIQQECSPCWHCRLSGSTTASMAAKTRPCNTPPTRSTPRTCWCLACCLWQSRGKSTLPALKTPPQGELFYSHLLYPLHVLSHHCSILKRDFSPVTVDCCLVPFA